MTFIPEMIVLTSIQSYHRHQIAFIYRTHLLGFFIIAAIVKTCGFDFILGQTYIVFTRVVAIHILVCPLQNYYRCQMRYRFTWM